MGPRSTLAWALLQEAARGSERHLCETTGDRALEFLDGCKAGQPRCLSTSFNRPHAEDGDPLQHFWPKAPDQLFRNTVLAV